MGSTRSLCWCMFLANTQNLPAASTQSPVGMSILIIMLHIKSVFFVSLHIECFIIKFSRQGWYAPSFEFKTWQIPSGENSKLAHLAGEKSKVGKVGEPKSKVGKLGQLKSKVGKLGHQNQKLAHLVTDTQVDQLGKIAQTCCRTSKKLPSLVERQDVVKNLWLTVVFFAHP